MDDIDIDDDHHPLQDDIDGEEEELIAAGAGAAAAAAAERRRLQLISVLEQKGEFSFRTRNKTDSLVTEFLQNLGDDIHDMLFDYDGDGDDYEGLDINRDTEKEVETAIRFFPEVLSRRKEMLIEDEDEDDEDRLFFYPIQILAQNYRRCNLKAVLFIPLLIRLAIEFGSFDEELRGGLLVLDNHRNNVLQCLAFSDFNDFQQYGEAENRKHHELVDDEYLLVMKKLRQMGCLMKKDIQRYGLVHRLCFFSEKRFRFIVEWDATPLTQSDEYEDLPLHDAATHSTIQAFRSVFKAGICYYPNKKGINLLFKKNCNRSRCQTPFQMACDRFGRDEVMNVIEDTLLHFQQRSDKDDDNSTGPYNVVDALITAAIDEGIHLDCVYFLLRRHPDVLHELLSSSTSEATATVPGTIINKNGHKTKMRKRKRGS